MRVAASFFMEIIAVLTSILWHCPQLSLQGGLSLSKTTLGITLIGVSTSVPDIGVQVNATFTLNECVIEHRRCQLFSFRLRQWPCVH